MTHMTFEKRLYVFTKYLGSQFRAAFEKKLQIKATSHSTIFDIPMRLLPEEQKHRHRFTR